MNEGEMGNFKSEERSTIGANVSVRFLGDEYSTNKVFVETADTNTTSSSPCPCAPASLRLGLAYLVNKKELNNTCWSPMLSDWIEACSPPVSEARGHVLSPNCIKVRRNQRQGARDNSLSNNTDTCNAFWSMEGVWAELQDLE
jgi:hypothetical protein